MNTSRINRRLAFTLVELLTVIAIVGVLVGLVAQVLPNFRRGDLTATATRQLIDDIARARQLAISHRTTVYMVFVPTNFWDFPGFVSWTFADRVAATNLAELQLIGYNFMSLRSVGEQPGRQSPRYLSEWRSLPEGVFILPEKFSTLPISFNIPYIIPTNIPPVATQGLRIFGFNTTTNLPFPRAETAGPYPKLPYIAFDHLGRLVSEVSSDNLFEAMIPLAHGSMLPMRNMETRRASLRSPEPGTPSVVENPPRNSQEAYNVVHIDQLTGRGRLITREFE